MSYVVHRLWNHFYGFFWTLHLYFYTHIYISFLPLPKGPYIPMGGSGEPQQPAAGVQPVQYTQQVAPQAAPNVPQPVQSNQPAQ